MPILSRHETVTVDFSKVCVWVCLATANPGYGVDGFLFHPSHLPGGLDDFVALVIPELQSRGLFRAEYEGTTLRENMELERPKSRYVSN